MAKKRNQKNKADTGNSNEVSEIKSKKKSENDFAALFPSVKKRYILLMLAICVVIYIPALTGDFFFDDEHFIVRNKYITDWKYLPDLLTGSVLESIGFKDNFYRPLSFVVYMAIYKITSIFHFEVNPATGLKTASGLLPFPYHLSSVIAHFLCGIMLFKIMMYICRSEIFSLLAALIFLCHPVETEAIAVACGLADPLSLFLLLLVVYYHIKLMETQSKFYIPLIFILAGLSFLAKERAGMAFLLVPIFDLAFIRKNEKLKDYISNKNRIFVWAGLLIMLLLYIQVRNMALNLIFIKLRMFIQ